MGKMKKKTKLVSFVFIALMLGSIFAGVASAVDTNNANESKNINIIERIISIIKFYDSKGDLLSTYSCTRCEISQSPNGKYIGVLETDKDFSQLNFTLFDQYGQVLWQKENFHPTIEASVPQVYISNDGKNVISATTRKKTAPYSILYFIGDSSKLSVKFPNKILLFELIKGEEGVAKE